MLNSANAIVTQIDSSFFFWILILNSFWSFTFVQMQLSNFSLSLSPVKYISNQASTTTKPWKKKTVINISNHCQISETSSAATRETNSVCHFCMLFGGLLFFSPELSQFVDCFSGVVACCFFLLLFCQPVGKYQSEILWKSGSSSIICFLIYDTAKQIVRLECI